MNLSFGEFTFRGDTRQLLRADAELHLSPKAFDLLAMLLDARPKAVSKEQISDRLWPRTFVTEANLSVLIAEVRSTLGDRPRDSRFIRTVPRFGYAFCGEANELSAAKPAIAGAGAPACWLVSGTTRTPIGNGSSIIGRDPQADIWLDLPGVSRQHARVDVNGNHITVVDLDSKNGTYVRDERIAPGARLHDGDEIRLGPVAFTFRIWSPTTQTKTASTSPKTKSARKTPS